MTRRHRGRPSGGPKDTTAVPDAWRLRRLPVVVAAVMLAAVLAFSTVLATSAVVPAKQRTTHDAPSRLGAVGEIRDQVRGVDVGWVPAGFRRQSREGEYFRDARGPRRDHFEVRVVYAAVPAGPTSARPVSAQSANARAVSASAGRDARRSRRRMGSMSGAARWLTWPPRSRTLRPPAGRRCCPPSSTVTAGTSVEAAVRACFGTGRPAGAYPPAAGGAGEGPASHPNRGPGRSRKVAPREVEHGMHSQTPTPDRRDSYALSLSPGPVNVIMTSPSVVSDE
ncbi:hypothetical protein Ga0074812_102418 [Parafrankia irregularis]|uniref:Uncharacterized protein n=1 Tax=Parafrankia irregularis TaxID=795642 RepID=A0A0S4QHY2_9ACTN|nr:hypothetical protein Ga0074812_102418 [Parafrankia irregularis]